MKLVEAELQSLVAAMPDMSLKELRQVWEEHYGAPPRIRAADLIRRLLAFRLQADFYGSFDTTTRRLIAGDRKIPPSAEPVPGMRLAREWRGRRHEVTVLDNGVDYEGQRYRSLSEVARHITGQRWNGPRFFGLRERAVR